MWLLSGNPVTRYADDLWSQLHLVWPKAFPSYWRFAKRYCVVEETPWGDKVVATRRTRDVMEENSDLVVVTNQEEVLELPEARSNRFVVAKLASSPLPRDGRVCAYLQPL